MLRKQSQDIKNTLDLMLNKTPRICKCTKQATHCLGGKDYCCECYILETHQQAIERQNLIEKQQNLISKQIDTIHRRNMQIRELKERIHNILSLVNNPDNFDLEQQEKLLKALKLWKN